MVSYQLVSKVLSDSINMGLFINGILILEDTFPTPTTGYSNYNSIVNIGYNNESNTQGFRGEVYALNIKNYFYNNQYNSAHTPFDGSAYFGIPNTMIMKLDQALIILIRECL